MPIRSICDFKEPENVDGRLLTTSASSFANWPILMYSSALFSTRSF